MKNILLIACVFCMASYAKIFQNNFISVDLPVGWECNLEGTEYICQSTIEARKKEAIFVIAAKMRGKSDSLRYYKAYLKKRKSLKLPTGERVVSEPKYVKLTKVNSQDWVDALHLSSEIPGYYTRYLATVKDDLGVAFTASIAQPYYSKYQKLLEKVVLSLKVFRKRGSRVGKSSGIKDKRQRAVLEDIEMVSGNDFEPLERAKTTTSVKKNKSDKSLYLYILLGLLVVLFIFSRRR